MESPPRRRYPLRSNRSKSIAPPRRQHTRSSSSSSAPPSPPPTGFGRAPAPPLTSPPASVHHRASSSSPAARSRPPTGFGRAPVPALLPSSPSSNGRGASSSAALDAATDGDVPISSEDIPVKLKGNHDKKKEVKESNEPRSSMKRFAGNQGTIEDHGNFIRVDTKELSSALTTHGVSYAERTTIFDNLVNRCNDILQETIAHERGRCQVLIKKISDLIDKYIPLCDVLGEPEKVSDIQMTASLKQLETFLSSTIPKLEELKQQRFKKLQELQGRLIDLWDSLGVTILKQKPYSFMMRNCTATLDEVVEAKALSPEILQKVEFEVARLELLLKKSVADKTRYVCTQAEMIYNDGKAPKYEEPADVPHFTEKVCTWEQEHGKKFLYNGHRLKGRLQSEAEGRRNLTAGTSLAAGAAAAEASWDSWSGSSASDHSSKDPNFCPSDDSEEVESRA